MVSAKEKTGHDGKYSSEEILMSAGWKFEGIRKTLQEEDNQLSVSMLCEVAGVSRSKYYRWVKSEGIRVKKSVADGHHVYPL